MRVSPDLSPFVVRRITRHADVLLAESPSDIGRASLCGQNIAAITLGYRLAVMRARFLRP